MVISDIGTAGDVTALLCHTNHPADSGTMDNPHSGGNWFPPAGTRVVDNDVPGFGMNRDPMVVRLYGNTTTDPPAEGIYYCRIPDEMGDLQTLQVGLYNYGGGNFLCVAP